MGNIVVFGNDPAQHHSVGCRGSTTGAPSLTLETVRRRTPEAASLALNCWMMLDAFPLQICPQTPSRLMKGAGLKCINSSASLAAICEQVSAAK